MTTQTTTNNWLNNKERIKNEWQITIKVNSIVASCIGILTFEIYNLVIGILLLAGNKKIANSRLTIGAEIVQILIGPFILVSLIMSILLQLNNY